MLSRQTRLAALGVSLWLTCARGAPVTEPADATPVQIKNFMFAPMTLAIKVGTAVTWVNRDDEPHTVVGKAGLFRSGALDSGMAFTFRFEKPGTYAVFCSIHPQMQATIIVE